MEFFIYFFFLIFHNNYMYRILIHPDFYVKNRIFVQRIYRASYFHLKHYSSFYFQPSLFKYYRRWCIFSPTPYLLIKDHYYPNIYITFPQTFNSLFRECFLFFPDFNSTKWLKIILRINYPHYNQFSTNIIQKITRVTYRPITINPSFTQYRSNYVRKNHYCYSKKTKTKRGAKTRRIGKEERMEMVVENIPKIQ